MLKMKQDTPVRLPNEYQEVEYIESTGTQYIDTGVAPTNKTNIKLDIEFISGESNKWIPLIAERTKVSAHSGYSAIFGIWINSNTKEIALNYADIDTAGITGTNGSGRHVYSNIENKFYLDNTLIKTFSASSFTSTLNLYVFALNELHIGSTNIEIRNCTAKLYELKIYNNSTLIRDFIPCYRKSDNEIGLYDLVNNVFYTNAGTGVFTMGKIVRKDYINLIPILGSKQITKTYLGAVLKYSGPIRFNQSLFPVEWDNKVTNGSKTSASATNKYGNWSIRAGSGVANYAVWNVFDNDETTYYHSTPLYSYITYNIFIECPILICPKKIYLSVQRIGKVIVSRVK